MIASAGAESYRRTIETVLSSDDVDAVIVVYIPIDRNDSVAVGESIREGVRAGRTAGGKGKPVLACIMAHEGSRSLVLPDEIIPTYLFPESAARVLSKVAAYSEWRVKPLAMVPGFADIQHEHARAIVQRAIGQQTSEWLPAADTRALLTAFGIPQVPSGIATSAEEAVRIAQSLGFPVVAKLSSSRVVHKTEAGAIRLGLQDQAAVIRAFDELKQDGMEGILLQQMIGSGVELMIGVAEDELFGPLIAFGLGGIHVEILGDVRFRVTPLTDQDAHEMVREIRGYRLLEGYRGHPAVDVKAVEDVLLRVSRMVEDFPQIRELDLNPIFGLPPGQGCMVADARIRVR
jgi:acyl-CoA synthetase (NDP forming)